MNEEALAQWGLLRQEKKLMDMYDKNDCDNYCHHYHQAVKQSRHLFTRFGLLSFKIPLFAIFSFETTCFIDHLFYSCGKYFL